LRRNCLQNKAIEGKGEVKGRRGRRRKQLPIDRKGKRRCWKFKGKHHNALSGELYLKASVDLS